MCDPPGPEGHVQARAHGVHRCLMITKVVCPTADVDPKAFALVILAKHAFLPATLFLTEIAARRGIHRRFHLKRRCPQVIAFLLARGLVRCGPPIP